MVNLRSAKKIASFSVALSTLAFVVGQAPRASALTFQFDYTYDTNNFFDSTTTAGQQRRATLEKAADYFEPFTDNLSAISVSGSNTWTPKIRHPGNGTTGFSATANMSIAKDEIVIFAGGYDFGTGVSTLGVGGPGGYSASGNTAFFDLLKARGQSGALASTPTDFGPWGGSLTFNTNSSKVWNYSHSTNPTTGQNDFLSVAIHELGHTLGIGTADSWDAKVSGTNFTGAYSKAEYGANVPLSGDKAHWANLTMSTVNGTSTAQEAAFDPSLTTGTRKLMTDLDYAGLTDVGWETQAVYSAAVPFEFSPGLGLVLVSGFFGFKVWQTKKS
jgi:hypothetical protein